MWGGVDDRDRKSQKEATTEATADKREQRRISEAIKLTQVKVIWVGAEPATGDRQ